MPYSNEIVRKARAVLASRKADHESRTLARLHEAYAKVPRIREIDILLRKSMAIAMQAAFQKGGDCFHNMTPYFLSRKLLISWIKLRTSWKRRYTDAKRI